LIFLSLFKTVEQHLLLRRTVLPTILIFAKTPVYSDSG
jgi:hypothetical protein